MNKAELVNALADRLGGNKKTAGEALDVVIDTVYRAVAKGEKVTITGFGSFEKVQRAARTGRNPATGQTIKVKKSVAPKFRPGQEFKNVVSGAKKLPRLAASSTSSTSTAKKSASSTASKRATAAKSTGTKSAASRKSAAAKTLAKKTVTKRVPSKAAKSSVGRTLATKTTGRATKKAATKTTATKKAATKKSASKTASKSTTGRRAAKR